LPAPAWTNVLTWTSAAGWSGSGRFSEAAVGPGRVRVTVLDAQPINALPRRFLRLLVTRP
jgi:hypothetical protein